MEEDIKQLEELILDRKSFVIGDKEHDEIYLKDISAIENLIKGYRELEDQIHYYASEIKEIADELEEEGFTEYANEINNTCILQDEFYGGKIK